MMSIIWGAKTCDWILKISWKTFILNTWSDENPFAVPSFFSFAIYWLWQHMTHFTWHQTMIACTTHSLQLGTCSCLYWPQLWCSLHLLRPWSLFSLLPDISLGLFFKNVNAVHKTCLFLVLSAQCSDRIKYLNAYSEGSRTEYLILAQGQLEKKKTLR